MTVENLVEKLGIWGKDKIVGENGKYPASNYYCVECYSKENLVRAEGFWPCIDLDIKDNPYCNPCISNLNIEIMIDLAEE